MRIPGPDYQATLDEEPIWVVVNRILGLSKSILADDVYSVLLSRTSRELRRHYGTAETEMIFAAVAEKHAGAVLGEISTLVPPADYRVSSPHAQYLWDFLGTFIAKSYRRYGDMVFTVLLACTSKELQKRVGRGGAGTVFQQFADTQREAAKFDL